MGYAVSVGWADAPLARFVTDARVQLAILMHPSGQVLAQTGFQRSLDVQTACALSAAVNATSGQLGTMIDGTPFRGLHYAGTVRQVYLGRLQVRDGDMVLLAVFDAESSLGIVQLYLPELQANIAAAAPPPAPDAPALPEDFERDLNRNLAHLFGRAG
jgi:hypothetical protein